MPPGLHFLLISIRPFTNLHCILLMEIFFLQQQATESIKLPTPGLRGRLLRPATLPILNLSRALPLQYMPWQETAAVFISRRIPAQHSISSRMVSRYLQMSGGWLLPLHLATLVMCMYWPAVRRVMAFMDCTGPRIAEPVFH